MPKKKNQSWNFKNPDPDTSPEYKAMYGGVPRKELSIALGLRGCGFAIASKKPNAPLPLLHMDVEGFTDLCKAAAAGDASVFRRVADCVDLLATNLWADPLAEAIWMFVFSEWEREKKAGCEYDVDRFMKTEGPAFNVEKFMRIPGMLADRKTITRRVRLLGLRVKTGIPFGTTKRKIR